MKHIDWFSKNLKNGPKVIILIGLFILLLLRLLVWGDSLLTATMTDAYLCTPFDKTSSFVKIDRITKDSAKELFVCGDLSTDGRPASLVIYIWAPDNILINATTVSVEPGSLAIPIPQGYIQTGEYRIAVSDNKEILAEFYITIEH